MISEYCKSHKQSEVENVIVRGYLTDLMTGKPKLINLLKHSDFENLNNEDKKILKELLKLADKELSTIHNESIHNSYRNIFIAAVYEKFGVNAA